MRPDAVLQRRAGAEGSHLGAEYILLDPQGTLLRGLNPSAAQIWEALDGRRTLAEIARALAQAHRAQEASVLADVVRFAEVLVEKGLAEPLS